MPTWLLPTLRRIVVDGLVALAVLAFLFFAVGPHLLPYRTVTMLTGSMRPLIVPGDVAVVVAEPVSALRPGQVITFHAPTIDRPVVTHRLVSVEHRDGAVLLRTKGDANAAADPWLAKVEGDTVWRLRGTVPGAGAVIRALRTPPLRPALLYVVPAVLLGWLLAGVWRRREETVAA